MRPPPIHFFRRPFSCFVDHVNSKHNLYTLGYNCWISVWDKHNPFIETKWTWNIIILFFISHTLPLCQVRKASPIHLEYTWRSNKVKNIQNQFQFRSKKIKKIWNGNFKNWNEKSSSLIEKLRMKIGGNWKFPIF